MIVDPSDQVICLAGYRLDRASGRLLRGARSVPLRLKTFAVLEYLALRPGRLVTKDELLDAVWPQTHVTPSVLAGCIRELRRALGDRPRVARFIETAHRRGYRFIAAPTASAAAPDAVAASERRTWLPGDAELAALARRFAQAVAQLTGRAVRRESAARRGRHSARRRRRSGAAGAGTRPRR